MAYTGQTIHNPVTGERITFLQTAADTDGALLELELELAADGKVPGAHVHPEQEERFHVLEGPFPPAWVVRAATTPLAVLARRRGHAMRYQPAFT